ncbi:uncharacterized protein LOC111870245 isoform X1 [Cryptotermes secundus]|uniref:uncharacterized protein LOC111870245 isoform X1 n=1 Tax=Cryptotermes secundus TaxID=105785 RepID=UPI000CD7B865|nr:uncharacterized protein LOC111870245 isoform X1 [Cryptotermes secundus]XP_023718130.1 uncharacterized protein LOC111870245 isoform X1 [Cryptotermes secundus]
MKNQRPGHYNSTGVIHETGKNQIKLFCSRQVPEEIRQFDVVLEEPDHVYFCGEEISGHVKVDLAGCLTVQGIIVRFVGEAYVSVPEQKETSPWNMRHISDLRRNLCNKNKISPSLSDLSGATSSCCGTQAETPDSPVKEGWTKGPRSQVQPLQRRRTKEQSRDATFRSHEKYFDHKMYVFGHKYSSKRERLWAGEHSFPFHYTLPAKLPASFHGRLGYIRYFCEAILERSALPNVQCQTVFSVSNIADVNIDPKADTGVSEQRSTNSCLFCCQKGTIIVSASIKRRAYVPGEDILISADVLNMSNTPVYRSCVKLIQVVTYFSNKGFRSHRDEVVISQVYRGRVACGESDTWDRVPVTVPPLPPTSKLENFCKLMEIEYRLDFIVEIAGETNPLEIQMPLIVGTVPLHREFSNLQPVMTKDYKNHAPPLILQTMDTKYRKLPAVFSGPSVWGPQSVELYYYRQVNRCQEAVSVRNHVPRAVLAPHQRDKVFVPRYICYRKVGGLAPDRGFAHGVPQIVITEHPPCLHHQHLPPTSRRHSAPGHIAVLTPDRVPITPTGTPLKQKLPDIPETK